MTQINYRKLPIEEREEIFVPENKLSDDGNAFRRMVFSLRGRHTQMISRENEYAAVTAWQKNRDQKALTQIVTAYRPMIHKMAGNMAKWASCQRYLSDLVQVGQVAFIEAIDRFDIELGNRLSTFASMSVAGGMIDFCFEMKQPLRTGTSAHERRAFFQYRAAATSFRKDVGRAPVEGTADEEIIANTLGIGTKAMQRGRDSHNIRAIPLQHLEIWIDQEERAGIDRIRMLIVREIQALADKMTPRDLEIARASLLGGDLKDTGEALATRYNLTVTRIGQIRRAAMAEIQRSLAASGITQVADVMAVGGA